MKEFKPENREISLTEKIRAGAEIDKDGYCGCPKCGSRKILHDGSSLDNGYISCLECHFSISGSDPYEMVGRWNEIDRDTNLK